MYLEQVAHWNDLTPQLRTELRERVLSYGKKVRYKFNISHENPDPTKHNGPIVWPFSYTLDPITFRIVDPHEKRTEKTASKQIGLVEKTDEKGMPNKFQRVKVLERHKGIVVLDLENEDHINFAMYLELHPKLKGGRFADKNKTQVFERIDELQSAKESRSKREEKKKALNAAVDMKDEEVKVFAAAMLWNQDEEMQTLRDQVEELAESNPEMFMDLVKKKELKIQANIKRALDKQVIGFDPVEYKFVWSATNQLIVNFGAEVSGKNHVERMAEWISSGVENTKEIYNRMLSLIK